MSWLAELVAPSAAIKSGVTFSSSSSTASGSAATRSSPTLAPRVVSQQERSTLTSTVSSATSALSVSTSSTSNSSTSTTVTQAQPSVTTAVPVSPIPVHSAAVRSNPDANDDQSSAAAQEFELKELYRIVGFLERQLSDRNSDLKKSANDVIGLRAQCELALAEIGSLREERTRHRQQVVALNLQVQELDGALKVAAARAPLSAGEQAMSALAPKGDAVSTQDDGVLPVQFYYQLTAVENELASEQRVNAELDKEAKVCVVLVYWRDRCTI
jgi:hypothetical protein